MNFCWSNLPRRDFLQLSATNIVTCQLPVRGRIARTVRFIRANCSGFLAARGDHRGVLWRGGDSPGVIDPAPDLLDVSVYGERGQQFFVALAERKLCSIDIPNAHIAAASRSVAAEWGTPVSIWPIGKRFNFAYWPRCELIFDDSRPTVPATVDGCGPLVTEDLNYALSSGQEVIFDAPHGFVAVSSSDTPAVAKHLSANVNDSPLDLCEL